MLIDESRLAVSSRDGFGLHWITCIEAISHKVQEAGSADGSPVRIHLTEGRGLGYQVDMQQACGSPVLDTPIRTHLLSIAMIYNQE